MKIEFAYVPGEPAHQLYAQSFRVDPTTLDIGYLARARRGLYDRGVASIMATVSTWSYSDVTTFADVMSHRGFAGGEAVSINLQNDALLVGTTAYLLQNKLKDVVILCFRGTEPRSIINWLGNINAKVEPFLSLGNVHGGFYQPLLALWRVLTDLLKSAMDKRSLCVEGQRLMDRYNCVDSQLSNSNVAAPGAREGAAPGAREGAAPGRPVLYITGHSLGGALAVLTAARIYAENGLYENYWKEELHGVYTFGQPMVGDGEFARRFDNVFEAILFRHIYNNDIAPRLPPQTAGDFRHIGEEYRSTESGWAYQSKVVSQAHSFVGSTLTGITAFFMDQLAGIPIIGQIPLPYSWEAHAPINYLRVSQMAHPSAVLL